MKNIKNEAEQIIKKLPKIELHRHLGGAVPISTIKEMFKKTSVQNSLDFIPQTDDEILKMVSVDKNSTNLTDFLSKFRPIKKIFTSPEIITDITCQIIKEAMSDGCIYLELRFSPFFLCNQSLFNKNDVIKSVIRAVDLCNKSLSPEKDSPFIPGKNIHTETIMILSRHAPVSELYELLDECSTYFGKGIKGVDLAGDENHFPPQAFTGLFNNLSSVKDLGITIHAGEIEIPENIDWAVENMHASRIGHGVWAIKSDYTLGLLKERGTLLEICPTSNLHTGVVDKIEDHPAHKLFDKGVRISISTDDPLISRIDLNSEYGVCLNKLGFDFEELKTTNLMAIDSAFTNETVKDQLRKSYLIN